MVTIYDILTILLPLIGLLFGGMAGAEYGVLWGILGAVGGGVLGLYFGRWPTLIMIRNERRKLAPLSSNELRSRLHDPKCWTPNFLLLELHSRGEDINDELPYVLDLMESEIEHCRMKGFAALLSAFPQVANQAKGYNPTHTLEKCKEKVADLRTKTELAGPPL